jgi:poly(3-hydroxybutyrate) depolymerase
MAAVSLLAAANDPVQPPTMTLMGGPIDTRAASTAVTKLAEKAVRYPGSRIR